MKRALAIADRASAVTFNLVLALNALFFVSFLIVAFVSALRI
jgi:hypothetical protein